MPEGPTSLQEAFDQAVSEAEPETQTPGEAPPQPPSVEEAIRATRQPDQADDTTPADQKEPTDLTDFMSDKATAETDGETEQVEIPDGFVEVGSDDFLNAEIGFETVDGPQRSTVRDLVDGNMRQADYTKKTQELAAQRRELETAKDFYDAYRGNPGEFARLMAIEAGLIAESDPDVDARPDLLKIPSAEELEERIQAEVDKRLQEDPEMVKAQRNEALRVINDSFDRLETKYDLNFSAELREEMIQEAAQRGVTDLELIVQSRILRAQERMGKATSTSTSPLRPRSPRPEGTTVEPADTEDGPKKYGPDKGGIRAAFADAEAEHNVA